MFYFTVSIIVDDFNQKNIPLGAFEVEILNDEFKRNIFEEGFYQESNYPFRIKPNFLTLVFLKDISSKITGSETVFTPDGSKGDLLGFKPEVIHEEYNLSDHPVDNLIFDNNFHEHDTAQGMIFKSKRSGNVHNWRMTVDPGYIYAEPFAGGISWYMMETKVLLSNTSSKVNNENRNLVSFNGQNITFRLSSRQI